MPPGPHSLEGQILLGRYRVEGSLATVGYLALCGDLPFEDEWESAARDDVRRIFSRGDDWDVHRLDSALDGSTGPGRVGRFPGGPSSRASTR